MYACQTIVENRDQTLGWMFEVFARMKSPFKRMQGRVFGGVPETNEEVKKIDEEEGENDDETFINTKQPSDIELFVLEFVGKIKSVVGTVEGLRIRKENFRGLGNQFARYIESLCKEGKMGNEELFQLIRFTTEEICRNEDIRKFVKTLHECLWETRMIKIENGFASFSEILVLEEGKFDAIKNVITKDGIAVMAVPNYIKCTFEVFGMKFMECSVQKIVEHYQNITRNYNFNHVYEFKEDLFHLVQSKPVLEKFWEFMRNNSVSSASYDYYGLPFPNICGFSILHEEMDYFYSIDQSGDSKELFSIMETQFPHQFIPEKFYDVAFWMGKCQVFNLEVLEEKICDFDRVKGKRMIKFDNENETSKYLSAVMHFFKNFQEGRWKIIRDRLCEEYPLIETSPLCFVNKGIAVQTIIHSSMWKYRRRNEEIERKVMNKIGFHISNVEEHREFCIHKIEDLILQFDVKREEIKKLSEKEKKIFGNFIEGNFQLTIPPKFRSVINTLDIFQDVQGKFVNLDDDNIHYSYCEEENFYYKVSGIAVLDNENSRFLKKMRVPFFTKKKDFVKKHLLNFEGLSEELKMFVYREMINNPEFYEISVEKLDHFIKDCKFSKVEELKIGGVGKNTKINTGERKVVFRFSCGKKIRVDMKIFIENSEYFKGMLCGGFKEREELSRLNEVFVKNFSYSEVQMMNSFFCGEFEKINFTFTEKMGMFLKCSKFVIPTMGKFLCKEIIEEILSTNEIGIVTMYESFQRDCSCFVVDDCFYIPKETRIQLDQIRFYFNIRINEFQIARKLRQEEICDVNEIGTVEEFFEKVKTEEESRYISRIKRFCVSIVRYVGYFSLYRGMFVINN